MSDIIDKLSDIRSAIDSELYDLKDIEEDLMSGDNYCAGRCLSDHGLLTDKMKYEWLKENWEKFTLEDLENKL